MFFQYQSPILRKSEKMKIKDQSVLTIDIAVSVDGQTESPVADRDGAR